MNVKEVKEMLKTKAGLGSEVESIQDEGMSAITCAPANLLKVAQALNTLPGLELTWLEGLLCRRIAKRNGGVWRLTYLLRSVAHERTLLGSGLNFVVEVPEAAETIRLHSVTGLWPMAVWMERDAAQWSGLEFE